MNEPSTPIPCDLEPQSISDYFLTRDNKREDADVTQMKLHKLMYFAQANYLAATGKRLFDSEVLAFEHGPIIDKLYAPFKKFGRQIIVVEDDAIAFNAAMNLASLPTQIKEFLDAIWQRFGNLSASQLRDLSHNDAPWSQNYLPGSYKPTISDQEMRDWYRSAASQDRQVYPPNVFLITASDAESLDREFTAEDIDRILSDL